MTKSSSSGNSKQRSFRTLIGLFAGVVGVALVLWLGWKFADRVFLLSAHQEIRRAGGVVTTETRVGGPYLTSYRAIDVDFSNSQLDDDQLAQLLPYLRSLANLDHLILRGTRITDTGLANLSKNSGIRANFIDVSNTRVTPEGLDRLRATLPIVIFTSGSRAFRHQGCNDLCFSDDGRLLALVGPNNTEIWDLARGLTVKTAPGGTSASFSGDAKQLAIASPLDAKVLNLEGEDAAMPVDMRDQSPSAVALSADGQRLFVEEFRFTHEYRLPRFEFVKTTPGILLGRSRNLGGLRVEEAVRSMVHPERGKVAGAIPGLPIQTRFTVIDGQGRWAAWSRDLALDGIARNDITIVELATGRTLQTLKPPAPDGLSTGGFDASGQRLVVGSNAGHVWVFEVKTGRVLLTHHDTAGATTQATLSRDGTKAAAAFQYATAKWWPIGE